MVSDCAHYWMLLGITRRAGTKLQRLWIHKSMVEIEDWQMQGRRYARRRLPSSMRGSVDDIVASEDNLWSLSHGNH